jgi:hypothetical protein
MWGGTPSRNMVGTASGMPDDIVSGKFLPKSETIDPKSTKNIRWVTKLGSQAYGTPWSPAAASTSAPTTNRPAIRPRPATAAC